MIQQKTIIMDQEIESMNEWMTHELLYVVLCRILYTTAFQLQERVPSWG